MTTTKKKWFIQTQHTPNQILFSKKMLSRAAWTAADDGVDGKCASWARRHWTNCIHDTMDRCKTPDGHCSRCLWLVESTNEEKQAYLHICIQFSFVMIYFCKRKTCVVRMRRTAKNHTRLQPFYRQWEIFIAGAYIFCYLFILVHSRIEAI